MSIEQQHLPGWRCSKHRQGRAKRQLSGGEKKGTGRNAAAMMPGPPGDHPGPLAAAYQDMLGGAPNPFTQMMLNMGGGLGGGMLNPFAMFGGDGDPPPDLSCSCGSQFGEYMGRAVDAPFPWDAAGPASRDVTTVWRGRRLRVLPDAGGEWQTARLVTLHQSNVGPFARETNWSMTLRFDSLDFPRAIAETAGVGNQATVEEAEAADEAETAAAEAGSAADTGERIYAHQTARESREGIYACSYRELQQSLKDLDLPATGRQAVLAERLYQAWLADAQEEWGALDEEAAEQRAATAEATAEVERQAASGGGGGGGGGGSGGGGRGRARSPSPVPPQDVPGVTSPPVELSLVRADVQHGGTLRDPRGGNEGLLLSFEWLDPAFPDLSLGEGLSCPMCRSIQPPTAGEGAAA